MIKRIRGFLKRVFGRKVGNTESEAALVTAVPEKESIESLSKHNATMIIFLSVGMIEELSERLMVGYSEDTPVAVVYKATWVDQKIVRGTLKDIAKKTKEAGITKTALVIVGNCLGNDYELSKLYDKNFKTEFRG